MDRQKIREWRKSFNQDKLRQQQLSNQLATKESTLNHNIYQIFKSPPEDIHLLEQNIK